MPVEAVKCKYCGLIVAQERDIDFRVVHYAKKYIKIIPVADGGLITLDEDVGSFCSDACLIGYLKLKEE